MKPAIPIAGAFVLGLVGSTVVGMKHTPPTDPAKTTLPPAVAAAPASASEASARPVSSPPSAPVDAPAVLDTAVAPAADSSVSRVASVLLKLAPDDAAPIAARMADSELVPVLRRMGVDKSAPLLAKLPTARARELSRLIITPPSSGTP
jgi:hypothetical protein